MKICLIEDDDYKVRDLEAAFGESLPNAEIQVFNSFREGAKALKSNWDLIIIDMQLPLFQKESAGKVYAFAGERLLRQYEREGGTSPVIVVSQFTTFSELLDEIDFSGLVERIRAFCPSVFHGAVQYSVGQEEWKSALDKLLRKLPNANSNCR